VGELWQSGGETGVEAQRNLLINKDWLLRMRLNALGGRRMYGIKIGVGVTKSIRMALYTV
jgi:hypothetical protein